MKKLSVLFLALFALFAGCTQPPSGDSTAALEKGRKLYEKGKHDAAFAEYEKAAREGNPEAMLRIAVMYETGEYQTDSPAKEALYMYTQAAHLGYAPAQSILGRMYLNGYLVDQDRPEGISWLTKAARAGHSDAQYLLAQAYEYGWGVTPDIAAAKEWYEQAALQGSDMAAFHMAQINREDPLQSAHWLARAAAYGDRNAYMNIAMMYLNGELAENDYVKACAWYKAGGSWNWSHCEDVDKPELDREIREITNLLDSYRNQI